MPKILRRILRLWKLLVQLSTIVPEQGLPPVSRDYREVVIPWDGFDVRFVGNPDERHSKFIELISPPHGFDSDIDTPRVIYINESYADGSGPFEYLWWISPLNPGTSDNKFGLSTAWCSRHLDWQKKERYIIIYIARRS